MREGCASVRWFGRFERVWILEVMVLQGEDEIGDWEATELATGGRAIVWVRHAVDNV